MRTGGLDLARSCRHRRRWVLDTPDGSQAEGASWHPAVKTHCGSAGGAFGPSLAPANRNNPALSTQPCQPQRLRV